MAEQESESPYNSPGERAGQNYRTPTNGGDVYEVNPRAEISTSVGDHRQGSALYSHHNYPEQVDVDQPTSHADNNLINPTAIMLTSVGPQRQGSGLRSHPSYVERMEVDQAGSHTDHEYSARVRRDSDSPVYNIPEAEIGSSEQVLEEFVPNSALNQSAPKFRERESTYEGRLYTYNGWDHVVIDKEVLAEAGLYYTGIGDTVKCAKCGETLSNWTSGDDPRQQHLDHFGINCF